MPIQEEFFGTLKDGFEVKKITFQNAHGLVAEFITFGGALKSLKMPDKNGDVKNVCLGYDNIEGYIKNHIFMGAIIGRYANRIAGGKFSINRKSYTLPCNDGGKNHLHGGVDGFDRKIWDYDIFESDDSRGVVFKRISPKGEEGYPGTLEVTVIYSLNDENELTINYKAETDSATPINLTNHTFWNFAGAGLDSILAHELELNCSHYLPVNDSLIPTGDIVEVKRTPFDFTAAKTIKKDIEKIGGYDHCFVIDRKEEGLVKAATIRDPQSGRGMEIYTTKPGIQLYTGNFLDGVAGADNAVYEKHDGLCLETQFFPDAVNKPQFPSAILLPGEIYHHITVHKFFSE